MTIPVIDSAKRIEQQFRTGEEPVLVKCPATFIKRHSLNNIGQRWTVLR